MNGAGLVLACSPSHVQFLCALFEPSDDEGVRYLDTTGPLVAAMRREPSARLFLSDLVRELDESERWGRS
jgi:hypothetical protein